MVVERTAVDVFLSSSRRLLAWPCEFARRLDMVDKSLGNRHSSRSVARSNTSLASSELLPLRRSSHVASSELLPLRRSSHVASSELLPLRRSSHVGSCTSSKIR